MKEVTAQVADKSCSNSQAKTGNTRSKPAHSGLSPIQFAFLQHYLDKNF